MEKASATANSVRLPPGATCLQPMEILKCHQYVHQTTGSMKLSGYFIAWSSVKTITNLIITTFWINKDKHRKTPRRFNRLGIQMKSSNSYNSNNKNENNSNNSQIEKDKHWKTPGRLNRLRIQMKSSNL